MGFAPYVVGEPTWECDHCGEKLIVFGPVVEDLNSGALYHEGCVLGAAEDAAEAQDQRRYEGV